MRIVRLYSRYLSPYRGYLAVALVLIVLAVAIDLIGPWPLKLVLDDVIKAGNPLHLTPIDRLAVSTSGGNRWTLLYMTIGLAVCLALLDAVTSYGLAYITTMVGEKVVSDLRLVLYAHLNRLSLSFHDKRQTGDLIARIIGDIDSIRDLLVSGSVDLISNCLSLIALAGVMLWLNWQLALLTLAIAPLLFFLVYHYSREIKRAARNARRNEGSVTSVVQESLTAVRIVQGFNREEFEAERFDRENRATMLANLDASMLQAQFSPLVNLLIALGSASVIFLGATQVLNGALTVGSIVLFTAYLKAIYAPIRQLAKLMGSFSRALASGERIAELLQIESTVREKPDALRVDHLSGRIEFDHVHFAYEPGFAVLEDISFEVQPGQKVALVGSTGAGKTSVASLIPRFYDVTCGRVLVDGHDVRDLTLASLRNQIGLVLQESVLFNTSARENIAYGRPGATWAEIVNAAKAANAHDFILALPHGYDTILGERGELLSGGQRQRIAVARAMIRNAPILILDEPTTALDAESENLALEALERLQQGRTTLVIAHRFSTIQSADLILVIEGGRIVERGTHTQLVVLNGRYRELYELQASIRARSERVSQPSWLTEGTAIKASDPEVEEPPQQPLNQSVELSSPPLPECLVEPGRDSFRQADDQPVADSPQVATEFLVPDEIKSPSVPYPRDQTASVESTSEPIIPVEPPEAEELSTAPAVIAAPIAEEAGTVSRVEVVDGDENVPDWLHELHESPAVESSQLTSSAASAEQTSPAELEQGVIPDWMQPPASASSSELAAEGFVLSTDDVPEAVVLEQVSIEELPERLRPSISPDQIEPLLEADVAEAAARGDYPEWMEVFNSSPRISIPDDPFPDVIEASGPLEGIRGVLPVAFAVAERRPAAANRRFSFLRWF